ncbi:hypothetical protein [Marinicellulosiphila megalodicopiae]|uniref:hypothetical protein n=1 Tax=Marinicellulosiphila megalodicopiae TaxID=2724896 RepID=UPI003BAFA60E
MKIEHINITVPNIVDTANLLTMIYPNLKKIGGWSGKTEKGQEEWAHYQDEECYVALEQVEWITGPQRAMNDFHGVNHVGLICHDIKAVIKKFEKNKIRYSIAEVVPERIRMYCFDKNGLDFEIVQYLTDDMMARYKYYNDADAKKGIANFLNTI